MTKSARRTDALVDEFVRYLNQAGFEPGFPDDVPEELRTSEAAHGMFNWRVLQSTSNPWIETLVQRLPQALPTPYLSLVGRYLFCNFEVGPVMFFGNTGRNVFHDRSACMLKDHNLNATLHKNGFLEFGKPKGGHYDPICFAMQHRNEGDAPVVQLDHEEILIRNRIRVVKEIAPSFARFLHQAVAEEYPVT
jgi:hypothetical protein